MTHEFALRVFYEDTDMAGVVYYANYLKFIERGRSDWIEHLGVDQNAMQQGGVVFAVRHIQADFLAPAKFGDYLLVRSKIAHLGKAEIRFDQQVWRNEELLFKAIVSVVCVNARGRATRLAQSITTRLSQFYA